MQDRSLTVSTTKFWGLTILFCSKQYSMLTFQAESDLPHAFPISGNGMVCSAVQLSLFSLFFLNLLENLVNLPSKSLLSLSLHL